MRTLTEVEKILTSLEGKLQYSRLVTVHATPYFCYEFQIYDYTSPLSHGRLKTSQWQAAQIGENRKSREKTYPSPGLSVCEQLSDNALCDSFSTQDSGLPSDFSLRVQESRSEVVWKGAEARR